MAQYKTDKPPPPIPELPGSSNQNNSETLVEDETDEVSTAMRFLTGKKLYLTGIESEKEVELTGV